MSGRVWRSRTTLLLGVLVLLGAILAQVAAERNASNAGPPLSSTDASPTGALALALWLQRLGYSVGDLSGHRSTPDDTVRVLFVLEPTRRFDQTESRAVRDWIQRGGTLVYVPGVVPEVGPSGPTIGDGLGAGLGASVVVPPSIFETSPPPVSLPAALPFFTTPPARGFLVRPGEGLTLQGQGWVPLIVEGSGRATKVIAATRASGRGRVYAAASTALFANQGIADADNAAFVLNILARTPGRGAVAFDEYHHGEASATDLAQAIRTAPWGWALMYAVAVTFAFALWGGRRFGPPLIPAPAPGRSAGDYVTAFAGLLQRESGPGALEWAQRHYAAQVRRRLAREFGGRADWPAADLARLVAERRRLDPTELVAHLVALDGPPLRQRDLLARIRGIERLLQKK